MDPKAYAPLTDSILLWNSPAIDLITRLMRMLVLGALLLGACRTVAPEGYLVATLPEEVNDWWVDISRDGSLAAYADRQGRQVHLVVGNRTYGPYT